MLLICRLQALGVGALPLVSDGVRRPRDGALYSAALMKPQLAVEFSRRRPALLHAWLPYASGSMLQLCIRSTLYARTYYYGAAGRAARHTNIKFNMYGRTAVFSGATKFNTSRVVRRPHTAVQYAVYFF
eukprot:SAG31_NODE_16942_length_689_cov_1.645763_1_plen_129_part_00